MRLRDESPSCVQWTECALYIRIYYYLLFERRGGQCSLLKMSSAVSNERAGGQARREMDQRARIALADLRARGLLSFRARSGNEEPTWAASERGRAVYESALPTRQGERLYEVRS